MFEQLAQVRAGVVIPVLNNTVLMAPWKKGKYQGLYGCPGGKMLPDELPIDGACREAEEEAGLQVLHHQLIYVGGINYGGVHADCFVWPLNTEPEFKQGLEPETLGDFRWVDFQQPVESCHLVYNEFIFPLLRQVMSANELLLS